MDITSRNHLSFAGTGIFGTELAASCQSGLWRQYGKQEVKMGLTEALLFALMAGLTVTGMAASLMEFFALRNVSFGEPFVSSRRIVRSLAATAAAGPFMLFNDALAARRAGRISTIALVSCACASCTWAMATGIVVVSLASYATRPLT